MIWLELFGLIAVVCFGGVLLFGAPYLPSLRPQINTALDLSGLKPGDLLLELGCGDGRVLRAAAKRGYRVVGIEINPILYLVSKTVTWRYRKLVKVEFGDFLRVEWPTAKAIFIFGLASVMAKVDKKIAKSQLRPVRLVSFGFKLTDVEPVIVDKGIFVYDYK